MKTLILVLLASFTSTIVRAQTPTDEVKNILHKIDEAASASENLRGSLRTSFEIKNLSFPDYPGAYDRFISDAEKVLGDMKVNYAEISNLVSTKHSANKSKLVSTRKYASDNPTKVNLELLKIEEERYQDETNDLNAEINDLYQKTLRSVYSLNDRLIYPLKGAFCSENNFLEKLKVKRAALKQYYNERGAAVYGNCKTSGCALTMAEHYQAWLKQVEALNVSLDLTPELKLNSISVVGSLKGGEALWDLAKYYSDFANLEPAVFEDTH